MISRVEDADYGGAERAEVGRMLVFVSDWNVDRRGRQGGAREPVIKRFVDPADLAALAVCRASDHARSIAG
jgi:hypothetical protein